MTPMNVLIACEESQRVCVAFRKKGHNAFSCDILPCSGEHPEWHIQGDCIPLLDGSCEFKTMDGVTHSVEKQWDMIIAFPPCTFLTNTGNRWFDVVRYGKNAQTRWNERCKAVVFFLRFAFAKCEKKVIENPIGCMSTYYRKPDQIVHPYYFAEEENDENCERKATCLWLWGTPPLVYRVRYKPRIVVYKNGKGTDSPWHTETMKLPPEERSRARSKTPVGLAKAMADQWG